MFFWFIGTSIVTIWFVFRDPRFDYRLLVVGSVLPSIVDVWFGGARVLHSLTFSVVLMGVIMLATRGRRQLRRTLLGLPLGTLLHLVFTGAWADTVVFWWPFGGLGFDDTPVPIVERSWWNLVLEAVGIALLAWVYQRASLADPARRRLFRSTGQLHFTPAAPG